MNNKYFLLTAVLSAFILSGCISIKINESTSLEGTTWKADTLLAEKINVMPGNEITLNLDEDNNKINGFGGCNTYFGNYIKDGDKIKIELL